ncbi:MAG: DUF1361 domain-containing protein [Ginsengibacter sp.]
MKISINQLLLLSTGFTVSMIISRVCYSGQFTYIFFSWNLFLAAIPVVISNYLAEAKNSTNQIILFVFWLLFFPNALYIVTDLVHLRESTNVPLWYDVIMIFSAALNGLIMAYLSLQKVELFLQSKFNGKQTNVIMMSCLFLGSAGVYIGRYLRWNSWDILINPFGLTTEAAQHFFNPMEHPRSIGMTIILTIFFGLFYMLIKKLPGLMSTRVNLL